MCLAVIEAVPLWTFGIWISDSEARDIAWTLRKSDTIWKEKGKLIMENEMEKISECLIVFNFDRRVCYKIGMRINKSVFSGHAMWNREADVGRLSFENRRREGEVGGWRDGRKGSIVTTIFVGGFATAIDVTSRTQGQSQIVSRFPTRKRFFFFFPEPDSSPRDFPGNAWGAFYFPKTVSCQSVRWISSHSYVYTYAGFLTRWSCLITSGFTDLWIPFFFFLHVAENPWLGSTL